MTEQHPINPPLELIQMWNRVAFALDDPSHGYASAAQWGADQELEACCKWVDKWIEEYADCGDSLREARRSEPPSLKEQAQRELDRLIALIPSEGALAMAEPIRQALEALPDA